jgi:hypothetical protein
MVFTGNASRACEIRRADASPCDGDDQLADDVRWRCLDA